MSEKQNPLSFKQALKLVVKRNLVRLSLLLILLMVWWGILYFRGENQYSVPAHTRVKARLSRMVSSNRLIFEMTDSQGKKSIPLELLATGGIEKSGEVDSVVRSCKEGLIGRLEGRDTWVQGFYLGQAPERTVGKVLINRPDSPPDDLGVQQIRLGCAFYCSQAAQYLSPAEAQLYLTAEKEAKAAHQGVWSLVQVSRPSDCPNAAP